jgi:xylan 1,4-beta-xylosidase
MEGDMGADFTCDWSVGSEPLPHFWEHTVGSCHAKLALRADYQAQLRRCHEELGFRHLRFHGLLCDDMSTVVTYRKRLLYSFFNVDRIWDFLLSIGMKPFVELGFMPRPLASGLTAVFHYRGNVTPPRDFRQWSTLVGGLARHWVERYGMEEVRQWFFEIWNEPNLKLFWTGSQSDYFNLYRHAATALKQVDSQLRVGGPATAKEEWIPEFLDFCAREKLPVDFVSTHHYPNDVIWHEGQDTERQLAAGRRGLLREWTQAARGRCRGLPLYYTEWNVSSNDRYPPQDEPYAAAAVVKTVMEANGLVECYSFWTFSDIFEEHYFPSVPFHGGFGLLTIHGIPKPTYRAFEIMHRLGTERLPVQGQHATVDAWVIRKPDAATILLTNHALPRHPIEAERVQVQLLGFPPPSAARLERIDHDHANAKRLWQEMGEPEYLTARQVERLEEASQLRPEPLAWRYEAGRLYLDLELPRHAVAAIFLEFETTPAN